MSLISLNEGTSECKPVFTENRQEFLGNADNLLNDSQIRSIHNV